MLVKVACVAVVIMCALELIEYFAIEALMP
jgi:hypothetical protein